MKDLIYKVFEAVEDGGLIVFDVDKVKDSKVLVMMGK